jgi:hypothetical protein
MVDWDSNERGIRIGDSRSRGLILSCYGCQHSVRVEQGEAVRVFGGLTFVGDLARALRCSKCGARKGSVMVWAHEPKPREQQT